MAYIRSLSVLRSTLVGRRLNPSLSYIFHHDDHKGVTKHGDLPSSRPKMETFLGQSFGNNSSGQLSGAFRRTGYGSVGSGLLLNRYMSTSIGDEVTVAAADSSINLVTAAQSLIQGVHSFTGFNWWASIAVTSLIYYPLSIPFSFMWFRKGNLLYQSMWPPLEWILKKKQAKGRIPQAAEEDKITNEEFLREYSVKTFGAYTKLLVSGSVMIVFSLAIMDMLEKVPSLKTGGLFHQDLTTPFITPETMCNHPILTPFVFWTLFETWKDERKLWQCEDSFGMEIFVRLIISTMFVPKGLMCFYFPSDSFLLLLVFGLFNR